MRISDWSSDVCSSDLADRKLAGGHFAHLIPEHGKLPQKGTGPVGKQLAGLRQGDAALRAYEQLGAHRLLERGNVARKRGLGEIRSEEHTSELQSLMRISYAVFCLKKKKKEEVKR